MTSKIKATVTIKKYSRGQDGSPEYSVIKKSQVASISLTQIFLQHQARRYLQNTKLINDEPVNPDVEKLALEDRVMIRDHLPQYAAQHRPRAILRAIEELVKNHPTDAPSLYKAMLERFPQDKLTYALFADKTEDPSYCVHIFLKAFCHAMKRDTAPAYECLENAFAVCQTVLDCRHVIRALKYLVIHKQSSHPRLIYTVRLRMAILIPRNQSEVLEKQLRKLDKIAQGIQVKLTPEQQCQIELLQDRLNLNRITAAAAPLMAILHPLTNNHT